MDGRLDGDQGRGRGCRGGLKDGLILSLLGAEDCSSKQYFEGDEVR